MRRALILAVLYALLLLALGVMAYDAVTSNIRLGTFAAALLLAIALGVIHLNAPPRRKARR